MIMCVLLCYPVSIRIYYQQGILFLVQGQMRIAELESTYNWLIIGPSLFLFL